MIFEFLLPIIGWLILFGILFLLYSTFFIKKDLTPKVEIEGQSAFAVLTAFFWIVVYMCLSSVWSIMYSLIDLQFPDLVGAVSDYGRSGFGGAGVVYDAFAFPLAVIVVSSVASLVLGFWLTKKFSENKNLRPESLYSFMRALVYIGGAVLAFSGFVYVVYSWLYGNLPVAIFLKGLVAFVIVGMVALYFYLTANGKNPKEALIGRMFAGLLVLVTIITLVFSFKVIGTPAEARLYRLDSITLENLKSIKYEIDNQDQNFGNKVKNLSEINSDYVKSIIKKIEVKYTSTDKDYNLCANFKSKMPQTINQIDSENTWDYKAGETCFNFKHLPTYATANVPSPLNGGKQIYNQ